MSYSPAINVTHLSNKENNYWKVLIVDDEPEVHEVTRFALRRFVFEDKKIKLLSAFSAQEAKMLVKDNSDIAVILLDVIMEEHDTGLKLVKHIRENLNNDLIRIVLRTGQPGEVPEISVITDYDINDYKTKTELTHEKLLTTMTAALRSYRDVLTLNEQSQVLLQYNTDLSNVNARLEEEVAARRQAEDALTQYLEDLEKIIAERTKELEEAQEQLIRQEKLAVLGQLSGSIGHELRTPLGVISNGVYILQNAITDPNKIVKKYLDVISRRVHEADRIISDLLTFSRTRSASQESCSLKELLVQSLENQLIPVDIQVSNNVAADLPNIYVDPQQIRQILVNLINNAYQAMPKGGELIFTNELTEDVVKLAITDTGCGITEEILGKIFEPLFTTKPKGTGLGLAICKNLMVVNKGDIEVSSKEGKSSTFTLSFPLAKAR